MQYDYCLNCFENLSSPDGKCSACGYDNSSYTPQPHHIPPQRILSGKYLVGKVLGEGGFGITYCGYDLSLQRKVAIKEFYPSGFVYRNNETGLTVKSTTASSSNENFQSGKEKCIQEARALAKLDDIPGVVRVIDFFEDNNTVYVIMDFIEGKTLKSQLMGRKEPMPFSKVIELFTPLMKALGEIHKRGFVHRDISPDNIIIKPDGKAVIVDFGAAKRVLSEDGNSTINPVLKRGFSPIEQYSTDGKIGSWTDVYAFCATLYYCITGQLAPEPMERLQDDVSWKKLLDGKIPNGYKAVILKGMELKSAGRYQTMEDLYSDFEKCKDDDSGKSKTRKTIDKLSSLFGKKNKDLSGDFETEKITPKRFKLTKGKVIAVLAVLAVILIGKGLFGSSDEISRIEDNSTYGRELCNINASGVAAGNDDLFLVTAYNYDTEKLNLYKVDGKSSYSYDVPATCINVAGDTVYYMNMENYCIEKIPVSGGKPQKLSDGIAGHLLYVKTSENKEKLYYLDFSDNKGNVSICCMDASGKGEPEVLVEGSGGFFTVAGNYLYYTPTKETSIDGKLCRVSLDSEHKTDIIYNNEPVHTVSVYNNELYLQLKSSIIVTDLNGKVKRELTGIEPVYYDSEAQSIFPIVVADSKIIYTNRGDMFLYCCDTEGKNNMCLVNHTCTDYEYIKARKSIIIKSDVDGAPLTAEYSFETSDVRTIIDFKNAKSVAESAFESVNISPKETKAATTAGTKNSTSYKLGISDPSNATNFGKITLADDGRIYFVNSDSRLSYADSVGGEYRKFNDSWCNGSVNVAGNNAYYHFGSTIYCCNISTGNITELYEGKDISNLTYIGLKDGEWLYFIDEESNSGNHYVYRMDVYGKNLKRISGSICNYNSLLVSGGYLFYIDADGKKLFRCNFDGSDEKVVYNAEIYISFFSLSEYNGYVYFIDGSEIIKIDYSGKVINSAPLSNGYVTITNGCIFSVEIGKSEVKVLDVETLKKITSFSISEKHIGISAVSSNKSEVYIHYTYEVASLEYKTAIGIYNKETKNYKEYNY